MFYKKERRKYKRRKKDGRSLRKYILLIGLLFLAYFFKKPLLQKIFPSKPEMTNEPTKYTIPILMYHYIEIVEDEDDYIREGLNITPDEFEKQMRYLVNRGYTSISFSDLVKILKSGQPSPTRSFIITFDDGYESFYNSAFPILKRYNLKAINFIVLNTLNFEDHLKDWQIEEMFESGLVEFGAHSVSHADLVGVSGEKLKREIVDSKSNLESQINIPVEIFSYPAGKYDRNVMREVGNAGYKAAVAIEGNYPHTKEDLFKLSRFRANKLESVGLVSFFKDNTND